MSTVFRWERHDVFVLDITDFSVSTGECVFISGPSGSGKSSMAKNLAEEMGLLYVDTGSMFRALALVAKKKGLTLTS